MLDVPHGVICPRRTPAPDTFFRTGFGENGSPALGYKPPQKKHTHTHTESQKPEIHCQKGPPSKPPPLPPHLKMSARRWLNSTSTSKLFAAEGAEASRLSAQNRARRCSAVLALTCTKPPRGQAAAKRLRRPPYSSTNQFIHRGRSPSKSDDSPLDAGTPPIDKLGLKNMRATLPSHPFHMEPDVRDRASLQKKTWSKPGPWSVS